MNHAEIFYDELHLVLSGNAVAKHDALVEALVTLRDGGGRLFCLGLGGGAANAAHAVNDFRKLCGIEAYAPTDGISGLTARANDEGWRTIFAEWLVTSHICEKDALFIFSVGGGTPTVSACLFDSVKVACQRKAKVFGVVGREDGATARWADVAIITAAEHLLLTPITEAAQLAVLHALVSDPRLQAKATKW